MVWDSLSWSLFDKLKNSTLTIINLMINLAYLTNIKNAA